MQNWVTASCHLKYGQGLILLVRDSIVSREDIRGHFSQQWSFSSGDRLYGVTGRGAGKFET
jgi:hypothetical protein